MCWKGMICFSGLMSISLVGFGHTEDQIPKDSIAQFNKAIEKIKAELLKEFDQAIEKVSQQGKLKELKQIENERKQFLGDEKALPSSVLMLGSRSKYESAWWQARSALEKDLKLKISEKVKAKEISQAEAIQASLLKVEELKLIPKDVSEGLVGKWKVSMVGKTKTGSLINYHPVWEFKKDSGVYSIDASISGSWMYDYKNKRVVISWDNQEKSKEAFFLPFNPDGMNGGSWHGFGVKMSAKKIIDN